MTQWKKLLKSFGFSENEANVYLTSLEMGPSSVQDLAKRAKVSRVTTYAVIGTLTKRGLMSTVEKNKKKLFIAESPERLISFVNARVNEMEGALKEVEASMHELKLIQRGEKPVVKMFEGPEALKAIQDDLLKTNPNQFDEIGNLDDIRRLYKPEDRSEFFDEMRRRDPEKRVLFVSKERVPVPRSPKEHIVTLSDDFDFHGDLLIYNNKIALSTLSGKQIAILIESEAIADTLRALFDLAWKPRK